MTGPLRARVAQTNWRQNQPPWRLIYDAGSAVSSVACCSCPCGSSPACSPRSCWRASWRGTTTPTSRRSTRRRRSCSCRHTSSPRRGALRRLTLAIVATAIVAFHIWAVTPHDRECGLGGADCRGVAGRRRANLRNSNPTKELLATELLATDADLLLVQELTPEWVDASARDRRRTRVPILIRAAAGRPREWHGHLLPAAAEPTAHRVHGGLADYGGVGSRRRPERGDRERPCDRAFARHRAPRRECRRDRSRHVVAAAAPDRRRRLQRDAVQPHDAPHGRPRASERGR